MCKLPVQLDWLSSKFPESVSPPPWLDYRNPAFYVEAGNLTSDLCAYVVSMLQTEPVGNLGATRPSTEFSLFPPDDMIPDVVGSLSSRILSGQRNSHTEGFPQQHRKGSPAFKTPSLPILLRMAHSEQMFWGTWNYCPGL